VRYSSLASDGDYGGRRGLLVQLSVEVENVRAAVCRWPFRVSFSMLLFYGRAIPFIVELLSGLEVTLLHESSPSNLF